MSTRQPIQYHRINVTMSAEHEKPEVDGQEVAKHTTRENGVWVIIHSA